MRTFCLGHLVLLLVAAVPAVSGCDESAPRRPADQGSPEPIKPTPDPSEPKYKLWIEAVGLGNAVLRLSLGGQKAVDVSGDGRVLALEGLVEGHEYEVWIDKPSSELACSLSATDAASAEGHVKGRIQGRDALVNLHCAVDDVRLATLFVHTRDVAMTPEFEPEKRNYFLEGHAVNDRVWLEASPANPQAMLRVRLDGQDVVLSTEKTEFELTTKMRELEIEVQAPSGRSQSYVIELSRRETRESSEVRPGDGVGMWLAISDKYLATGGAKALEDGVVHVFRRSLGGWIDDGMLLPTGGSTGSASHQRILFGSRVAIWGNWLAVSAPYYQEKADDPKKDGFGAVFVYRREESGWVERARIRPTPLQPDDLFGMGLAMGSNLLAVGNPRRLGSTVPGAVEIYRLGEDDSVSWRQTLHGTGLPADEFGCELAMDEHHVAVSACNEHPEDLDPLKPGFGPWGAVYLFSLEASGLTLDSTIKNPSTVREDPSFGTALALRNGLLAVGAYLEPADETSEPDDNTDDGAVYVFRRGTDDWSLTHRLPGPQQPMPAKGESSAQFGVALAITQDALWVGAQYENLEGQSVDGGTVYTYPFTSDGSLSITPLLLSVTASAPFAQLGANMAASSDGVVAISEPFSAFAGNGKQGIVHILQ